MHADIAAGDGTEGYRIIGRPEHRSADRFDRVAALLGHDGVAVHVRGLALIGAHAERGVTFEMLNRDIALAMC
jgi:hypothetical protein